MPDTDKLAFHAPLADGALLRSCQEHILFLWMPFTVVNRGDVSLSITLVVEVHISSDSGAFSCTITTIDLRLVIAAATEEALT